MLVCCHKSLFHSSLQGRHCLMLSARVSCPRFLVWLNRSYSVQLSWSQFLSCLITARGTWQASQRQGAHLFATLGRFFLRLINDKETCRPRRGNFCPRGTELLLGFRELVLASSILLTKEFVQVLAIFLLCIVRSSRFTFWLSATSFPPMPLLYFIAYGISSCCLNSHNLLFLQQKMWI